MKSQVKQFSRITIVAFLFFITIGCDIFSSDKSGEDKLLKSFSEGDFSNYWYGGKAELNRFELQQARYGEVHAGHAVMVFVTEDFFKKKQVKYESGEKENTTTVMKVNFIRKFPTGIYDYSMMSSVFSPVQANQQPYPLKVSTSSQEWCGHTYLQLNLRGSKYDVTGHSYFQKEADQEYAVDATYLEDGIWNTIRIAPEALPEGDLSMIPGTMYTRLRHRDVKPEKAHAELVTYKGKEFEGKNLVAYKVEYADLNRVLSVVFENKFPYQIAGWTETYTSGWGKSAKALKTVAKRTQTIKSDYWNKNNSDDFKLRKKLGVPTEF